MAHSDPGIKLHLKLQNSFINSRCSSKGASDTGTNPSHGEKRTWCTSSKQPHNSFPLNPARPKLRFPSGTLCTRCSSLSWGNGLGFYHHPSLCFKRMDLDCCSYKASSIPRAGFKGLRHTSSSYWSTAHFLSSLRFLKTFPLKPEMFSEKS